MKLKKSSIITYLVLPLLVSFILEFIIGYIVGEPLLKGTVTKADVVEVPVMDAPSPVQYEVFVNYEYSLNKVLYKKTESVIDFYDENEALKELKKYVVGSNMYVVINNRSIPEHSSSIKISEVKTYFVASIFNTFIIYLLIVISIFLFSKLKSITSHLNGNT